MIVEKKYKIPSCDDAELNIKRPSPLGFTLIYDDQNPVKAILVIAQGMGADSVATYKAHLAQFAASEFGLAVLLVDYFCIANRLHLGAKYKFDKLDKQINKKVCADFGITLSSDILSGDVEYCFNFIGAWCERLKALGHMSQGILLPLSVSIVPAKREYNNFGIMSAIDIINACIYIDQNRPFKCDIEGGGGGRAAGSLVW